MYLNKIWHSVKFLDLILLKLETFRGNPINFINAFEKLTEQVL